MFSNSFGIADSFWYLGSYMRSICYPFYEVKLQTTPYFYVGKQSTNSVNVLTYFKHGLLRITKYQENPHGNHAAPKVIINWMFLRYTMYISAT